MINGYEKDNAEILDAIHKAYLATVPDGWFDWRPEATGINEIWKQLEEIPNQNDSTPPLLKFIAHLVHQLKDSKKFQTFRENLLTNFNPPKLDLGEISSQSLQCYLLLLLRSIKAGQLMLKAVFIPDDSVKDNDERFQEITVDELRTEIPCVAEKMQMRILLSKLIEQCHYKYIKGKDYDLTIEIFLPQSLLYQDVEKWDYKDSQDCLISIGTEHSVVVRSYERLNKPDCVSHWRKKWLMVKNVWENHPTDEEFITLTENNFDRSKLRTHLKNKIGVKVACDPSNSKMEELYSAIHSAGIPIMLLSRREVATLENPAEFDELLKDVKLKELPKYLKTQRENPGCVNNDHLGNHLALLWDDPNRVPPNFPLQSLAS